MTPATQRRTPAAPAAPPRRAPLGVRKQHARARAAEHLTRTMRTPLTPAQRAYDPLAAAAAAQRSSGRKLAVAALALLGAVGVHAAAVGVAVVLGGRGDHTRDEVRQQVTIEVKPPPPPPPAPPEPTPAPAAAAPVSPQPTPPPKRKLAAALPPPPDTKTPPPEPDKAPPPRVIGLSLESTVEGGEGPSFAVGNSRLGVTAKVARDKQDVVPGATGPDTDKPINRVASRVPTAGVAYTPPRRTKENKPPYPPSLMAQGVEANVTLMISISATGKVQSVKVIKPSPYPEFNEAARRAALEDVYEPATREGIPIPYTLSFTSTFRLEDGQ